jgi:hypothetical protein
MIRTATLGIAVVGPEGAVGSYLDVFARALPLPGRGEGCWVQDLRESPFRVPGQEKSDSGLINRWAAWMPSWVRMLNPVDGIIARLLMEGARCMGECLIDEHH